MYKGVVVISINDDSRYAGWLKSKLNGNGSYYITEQDGIEEVSSFCESHGIEISDGSKDAHYDLLLLGAIHKGDEDTLRELILSECCICDMSQNKCELHFRSSRSFNRKRHEAIIEDFQNSFNLKLSDNYKDSGYIQIEPSKKAIEKVAFYVTGTNPYPMDERQPNPGSDGGAHNPSALKKYRQKNRNIKRAFKEPAPRGDTHRGGFQTDYERIVHTKAFRRLVDKAQVFSSSKGDHYRTRMTHTLEVDQIARAISKVLGLNMMLTEAIALGHDIGHTPFGHQGERALDDILKGRALPHLDLYPGGRPEPDEARCDLYGGFKHNFQSVRVLESLEEDHVCHRGINASAQVLEGILWHTKTPRVEECVKSCSGRKNGCCTKNDFWNGRVDDEPLFWSYVFHEDEYFKAKHSLTLEGQVVAIADEIAQRSHDVDDALTSGILSLEELLDLSRIRSVKALHDALVAIDEDIKRGIDAGFSYIDVARVRKARAASAIIHFLIRSVLEGSKLKKSAVREDVNGFGYVAEGRIVNFDEPGEGICAYLEQIVTSRVLNSAEVTEFDNKGRIVVEGLFEAYYLNSLMLPRNVLKHMAMIERRNGCPAAIDLSNCSAKVARLEIETIQRADITEFEPASAADSDGEMSSDAEAAFKKAALVRVIVDHIAGMTDSFAMNEYRRIYGMS